MSIEKEVITKTFISAQRALLNELLGDIENEGYKTVSEIKVVLHKHLLTLSNLESNQCPCDGCGAIFDLREMIRGDDDSAHCLSCDYVRISNLDNLTDKD